MSNTQNAENTQKQNTLRMAYLSLMKNLSEAPQAPKFFEICHTPLSLKYNERAVG